MLLSHNASACALCAEKNCFSGCPNFLSDAKAFGCRHCVPATAPCMQACARHAIFEISEGILGIEREKCNGCGRCAGACETSAIIIENGKAAKCDLCAARGFEMPCLIACEKKSVFRLFNAGEKKHIARLVGWLIRKIGAEAINKVLRETDCFEIVETRDSEKKYLLKDIPNLSLQEARVFRRVLDEFQSSQKQNNSIEAALNRHCSERMIEISAEQKKYLLELLESTAFGFGPLTKLLENDEIEEIAVIGIGKSKPVFVFDRSMGWLATNLYYFSAAEVKNLANRMAQGLGRRLSMQTPKINAILEDGSRLHASIEPVAFSGPNITIRKFRQEPFTPADLVENKTISTEAMAFLWMAMQTDCSLLIAGNTGSGKTSTLNALFCFVPKSERIISVEETPELKLPHTHIVKMNVAENLGIGMQQLIVDSLRMRPDRVLVGEIRNREETLAFIDTLLAGQGKGSYATFHAQSAKETIVRLKSMGVSELDLASIDLILVQRRWNRIDSRGFAKEQRRVIEISEVAGGSKGLRLNALFGYDYKKESLEKINRSEKVFGKIEKCFSLGKKGIDSELKKRAVFLKALQKEKPKLLEFFGKVNSHA